MNKAITVFFSQGELTVQVPLSYLIADNCHVQTISCEVTGPPFPGWLRMRKFELLSARKGNSVERLFTDNNLAHNRDTDLFMDHVYNTIMSAEKFRVLSV